MTAGLLGLPQTGGASPGDSPARRTYKGKVNELMKRRQANIDLKKTVAKQGHPVFEGMPMMNFEEKESNWAHLFACVLSPLQNRMKSVLKLSRRSESDETSHEDFEKPII